MDETTTTQTPREQPEVSEPPEHATSDRATVPLRVRSRVRAGPGGMNDDPHGAFNGGVGP